MIYAKEEILKCYPEMLERKVLSGFWGVCCIGNLSNGVFTPLKVKNATFSGSVRNKVLDFGFAKHAASPMYEEYLCKNANAIVFFVYDTFDKKLVKISEHLNPIENYERFDDFFKKSLESAYRYSYLNRELFYTMLGEQSELMLKSDKIESFNVSIQSPEKIKDIVLELEKSSSSMFFSDCHAEHHHISEVVSKNRPDLSHNEMPVIFLVANGLIGLSVIEITLYDIENKQSSYNINSDARPLGFPVDESMIGIAFVFTDKFKAIRNNNA